MAKQGASNVNVTLNSVSIEDELNNTTLNVNQQVVDARGFSQLGPEGVADGYGWNVTGSGSADFDASQGDATIFAMLSSAAVSLNWDPTGGTVGTDDPHYDGNVLLSSYSITAATGSQTTYSVDLFGAGALSRNTS